MTAEWLLRVWRVVVLCLGAFDIGFALMICWLFLRGGFGGGPYGHPRHVVLITISYSLLAFALWAVIAGKALGGLDVTWRLPLATVAFPLGIVALYRLLQRAK